MSANTDEKDDDAELHDEVVEDEERVEREQSGLLHDIIRCFQRHMLPSVNSPRLDATEISPEHTNRLESRERGARERPSLLSPWRSSLRP